MTDKLIPTSLQMHEMLMDIMRGVNAQLFTQLGNKVICGPFKGMWVKRDPNWDDGNSGTKLLGCYEFELQDIVKEIIFERKPKTVINVGCAEGYYAVGFAMTLNDARVVAYDVDEESLKECWHSANENGVCERMQFIRGCKTPEELNYQGPGAEDKRLYVLDCEGDELELLDKEKCPALTKSDVLVECHEFLRPGLIEELQHRFSDTHDVKTVKPKLPPLDRYPFLAEAPWIMSVLAVTEKRPMPTCWLACWAH
jgi:hypothetical protein